MVDGRAKGRDGMTLAMLQKFIQKYFTSDYAYNLDGGGSAQIYLSTRDSTASEIDDISIHGTDKVPVMLALLRR